MTGTAIGLNLKYLPWQLFVPAMFGLSILCVYGAITIKGKGKTIKLFLFCLAIVGVFMGIERLAISTGIGADYLPFLKPIIFSVMGIAMLVLFIV